MNYSTLLVDIADGVATITLNRPERLNCFNRAMVLEFRDLWARLRADLGRTRDACCAPPRDAPSARAST